jgi:hypothetical protein
VKKISRLQQVKSLLSSDGVNSRRRVDAAMRLPALVGSTTARIKGFYRENIADSERTGQS